MTEPTLLRIRHSGKVLTPTAGLALVGQLLRIAQLAQQLDPAFPVRHGIRTSDVVKSYVGLLCQGKSDFDAIEAYRDEAFFAQALGVGQVPSAPTLRQRLDALAVELAVVTDELPVRLLKRARAPITALGCGYVALDLDVFPLDNSGTHKEGVSRTYHGFDGYAPIAAYLGQEGWCLALELREGKHHSAGETDQVLERVLPRAQALSGAPLLVRLDAGFDSARVQAPIVAASAARVAGGGARIDLLCKWNPRATDHEALYAARLADPATVWSHPRPGKRVTHWEVRIERRWQQQRFAVRRLLRLSERTRTADGQALLLPELQIEGWDTTLPAPAPGAPGFSAEAVLALYADHATHEQFHSEFKSDLDLERLPSGKFATNDAVLSLGMLAYNVLRLIGQRALLGPDAPLRHPAKRRRLKTVIQTLLCVAAHLVHHARQCYLDLGKQSPVHAVFARLYRDFCAAPG